MRRKQRTPKSRREPLPPAVMYVLEHGELPPIGVSGRPQAFRLLNDPQALDRLREELGIGQ